MHRWVADCEHVEGHPGTAAQDAGHVSKWATAKQQVELIFVRALHQRYDMHQAQDLGWLGLVGWIWAPYNVLVSKGASVISLSFTLFCAWLVQAKDAKVPKMRPSTRRGLRPAQMVTARPAQMAAARLPQTATAQPLQAPVQPTPAKRAPRTLSRRRLTAAAAALLCSCRIAAGAAHTLIVSRFTHIVLRVWLIRQAAAYVHACCLCDCGRLTCKVFVT